MDSFIVYAVQVAFLTNCFLKHWVVFARLVASVVVVVVVVVPAVAAVAVVGFVPVVVAYLVDSFVHNIFVAEGVSKGVLLSHTSLLDFLDLFGWGIYFVAAGSFVDSH